MSHFSHCFRFFFSSRKLLAGLSVCVLLPLQLSGVTIKAQFSPAEISLGERSELSIQVTGGKNIEAPELNFAGLDFQRLHSVQSYRQDKQVQEGVTTLHYLVTPQEMGIFQLGGMTITIDGRPYPLPQTGLIVRTRKENLNIQETEQVLSQAVKLEVDVDQREIFSQEIIPFRLTLSANADLPIRISDTLPHLIGGNFQLLHLQPSEDSFRDEIIDGNIVKMVWKGWLMSERKGNLPLQFATNVQVKIPKRGLGNVSQQNVAMAAAELFDNQGEIWQSIIVRSTPVFENVSLLPEMERPENFTGAIGSFSLGKNSLQIPEKMEIGSYITLSVSVEGQGNFSKITPPSIDGGKDWRLYRTQKSLHYADSTRSTGSLTFYYTLLPQHTGNLTLPKFQFSFFDPQQKKYITLEQSFDAPIFIPRTGKVTAKTVTQNEMPEGWKSHLPSIQHGKDPSFTNPILFSLEPLYRNPWFWGIHLILFYIFLVWIMIMGRRYQRRFENLNYIGNVQSKQTRAYLRIAKDAANNLQPEAFYHAIKLAFSNVLSEMAQQNPHVLTSFEVRHLLQKWLSGNTQLIDTTVKFFEIQEDAFEGDTHHTWNKKRLREDFQKSIKIIQILQSL